MGRSKWLPSLSLSAGDRLMVMRFDGSAIAMDDSAARTRSRASDTALSGSPTSEKAGTPGVMQTIKAALAFAIKDDIGTGQIAARERELLQRALECWHKEPGLEILGNPDPARRIGIVSFNAREPHGRYLHPKFITALLNDLFGIQSRAGCSCAGPYGHRLLQIDQQRSEQYRQCVGSGYGGLKPGWCRVGFHYTMDDIDADYVIEAVSFVGQHGHRFLSRYDFDLHTGTWSNKDDRCCYAELSLASAVGAETPHRTAMSADRRKRLYRSYLDEAKEYALQTAETAAQDCRLPGAMDELQFFALDRRSIP